MFESVSLEEEAQKRFIRKEMRRIMAELEKNLPHMAAKLGAVTGAGVGTASAIGAGSFLSGTGVGLSGIKAGLLFLGGTIGGSLAAGMAVAVAPAALCSVAGYRIARKIKRDRHKEAYAIAKKEFLFLLEHIHDLNIPLQKESDAISEIISVLDESLNE